MPVLAVSLASGVALGYACGGRLRHLAGLRLRAQGLVVAAALVQLGIGLAPPGARFSLVACSYGLLGGWLVVNAADRTAPLRLAIGLFALGWLLNLWAMAPNGGMPVSLAALRSVGGRPGMIGPAMAGTGANVDKHVPVAGGTQFSPLGDVLALQPLATVVSVGDLSLAAGLVLALAAGMAGPPGFPPLGHPAVVVPLRRSRRSRPAWAATGWDGVGEATGPPLPNPLERAAAIVEQRGWCRNQFRDPHGRVCLDFALIAADLTANAAMRRCVRQELTGRGVRCTSLVAWNDFLATDGAEVVSVLRAAAARWAREHDDERPPAPSLAASAAGAAAGRRPRSTRPPRAPGVAAEPSLRPSLLSVP